MNIAVICTALLGLLLFGLGLYVSILRVRTGRNIGCDTGPVDLSCTARSVRTVTPLNIRRSLACCSSGSPCIQHQSGFWH